MTEDDDKTQVPTRPPIKLGPLGVLCAVCGFLAWIGYATFEARGNHAAATRQPTLALEAARIAGWFSLAHWLLAISAIGIGRVCQSRELNSRISRRYGNLAFWSGVVVLSFALLIV